MTAYTDTTYQFQLSYPAEFVLRTLPPEKLSQLTPVPVATLRFLRQALASNDLEAADLEIRVYDMGQEASLERWLVAQSLVAAGSNEAKPFQTERAAGTEVCASTMIAPGCSYFFVAQGLVYQLIPASLEGEAMMKTFQPPR